MSQRGTPGPPRNALGSGLGGAAHQAAHAHAGWILFVGWMLAYWWLVLRRIEGPPRATPASNHL